MRAIESDVVSADAGNEPLASQTDYPLVHAPSDMVAELAGGQRCRVRKCSIGRREDGAGALRGDLGQYARAIGGEEGCEGGEPLGLQRGRNGRRGQLRAGLRDEREHEGCSSGAHLPGGWGRGADKERRGTNFLPAEAPPSPSEQEEECESDVQVYRKGEPD